jgi:NADPH-dependent 2,4-dienoyl-CoA reductase/sulfur reductase-like enzyme/rhodanese-related sulfurtransferase
VECESLKSFSNDKYYVKDYQIMTKTKFDVKKPNKQKICVVGAVAGGASFVTRARRLSEKAEIIMFDRGPHVSFASCGLPYYVGNVIPEESELLMVKPEDFKGSYNIDVRLHSEVISVDRKNRKITVKDVQNGKEYMESYDILVLATGSQPVRPKLPGIDLPGIFTLRNIPDSNQIKKWIKDNSVKEAVVVGGGLIGLEMTENLTGQGVSVTIVEMLPHVIPFFDPEMAIRVHGNLKAKGVKLNMNTSVRGFSSDEASHRIRVMTEPDKKITCDMVILSIGSRPEANIARDAGLEIGQLGGLRVNEQMQTSDESIYAVGDVVESRDVITGEWALSLLSGPASRQARIAADAVFGRKRSFRGIQATAACRIFDADIASTGVSETNLKRYAKKGNIIPYETIYLISPNHADYYPGSSMIFMKLIFSTKDGRILGAQAVGAGGVEKRIDVIAMAAQMGGTVYDLEEAELCYAPQFGAAKDVVDIAGMAAANILRGDIPTVHWSDVNITEHFLLDVREADEFKEAHIEGSINAPFSIFRQYLDKLDKNKKIYVFCNQGKMAYFACRILLQNGFDCVDIAGGFKTYQILERLKK